MSERKHKVEDSKTLNGLIISASIIPAFKIDVKYLNDIWIRMKWMNMYVIHYWPSEKPYQEAKSNDINK
jgi:hypothetical protein